MFRCNITRRMELGTVRAQEVRVRVYGLRCVPQRRLSTAIRTVPQVGCVRRRTLWCRDRCADRLGLLEWFNERIQAWLLTGHAHPRHCTVMGSQATGPLAQARPKS